MEVLIEAIIWLFQTLFGTPEKPADMSRPPSRTEGGRRVQRGPYSYGDESGGSRPKTLEEILAEVRQQAAQKREVAPPPAAKPPAPAPVRDRRLAHTPNEALPSRRVGPPLPSRPKAPPPPPPGPPLSERQPESRLGTVRIEKLAQEPTQAHLAKLAPHTEAPPEPAPPPRASRRGPPTEAPVAGAEINIVRLIRRAPREAKLAAARQAVVVGEVLGLPRSRRPWNPGVRLF